jgi:parallel beta-helix repeat protein
MRIKAKKWEILASLILAVCVVLPAIGLASSKSNLYVDSDATWGGDGSVSHPYKTISEALKHADSGDDVHVAAGTYKDNIEIPEGVDVYGESAKSVTIKAKDDDKSVVVMDHKTEINKVTIEGGRYGINVKKKSQVSIINCVIRKNDRDGIIVRYNPEVKDKYKVSITDNIIKENNKSGIYAQKSRLILIDNEISDNDNDGVEIESGTRAWIKDNKIKDNNGSGMKLVLDASEIWLKSNSIRNNDREGVEVNAFGGYGLIDINQGSVAENNRYGIARIARKSFVNSTWNNLRINNSVDMWGNTLGNVSPIIRVLQ